MLTMQPAPRASIAGRKARVAWKAAKYGAAIIDATSCGGVSSTCSQRPAPALLITTAGIAQIAHDPARCAIHVVGVPGVRNIAARGTAIGSHGCGNRFDLRRACQHRNARPAADERFGGRLADTAGRACNHDRLTVDPHDVRLYLRSGLAQPTCQPTRKSDCEVAGTPSRVGAPSFGLPRGGESMIFEPFNLKGIALKNRVLRSSMGGRTSYFDGTVSPAWAHFESRFADTGVAAIISATISVDDKRCAPLNYPKISDDRFIAPFRAGIDAVHARDCRYIMQIGDGGYHAQMSLFPKIED